MEGGRVITLYTWELADWTCGFWARHSAAIPCRIGLFDLHFFKQIFTPQLCVISQSRRICKYIHHDGDGGGCSWFAQKQICFPSRSEPAGQDRRPFGSWLLRCKMQKSGKAVSFSRTVLLPRPILLQRHNHAKQQKKKKKKKNRRGQARLWNWNKNHSLKNIMK